MSSVEALAEPQVEVRVAYDFVSWWAHPELKGKERQHRHADYDEVVSMPASEAERLRRDSPGSLVDVETTLRPREHSRRPSTPQAPTSPESADPDALDGAANEYTQEAPDEAEDEPETDAAEDALDDYMAMNRKQLVAFSKKHGVEVAARESKASLAEKLIQRGVLPPPIDDVDDVEGDHAMTAPIEPAEDTAE